MKKILLLLSAILMTSMLLFVSCVEDKEPCEEDNFGSVTITNNSGEYWVFDVTYQETATGWTTNEEVTIYNGESYTWEEVGAGTIAIWVSDPFNDWTIAQETTLAACGSYTYNATDRCQLFNWATATVKNEGTFTLIVDAYDESGWIEERTLYAGYETEYKVIPGEVKFGASNGYEWTFSDYYNIYECEDFEFSWNANKLTGNSQKSDLKVNYVRPTKAGSKINMDELPRK